MSTNSGPADPDRRARLRALALQTLVRDNFAVDGFSAAVGLSRGAAGVHDGTAYVLVDDSPERGLGAALAWALRHEATTVRVLASGSTGLLARRAAEFALDVSVWHVDERLVVEAIAEPLPEQATVPDAHLAFADVIRSAGAEVRVEHGVMAGEVVGLEVCRVVTDLHTGVHRLEVGVGAHDREAFGMLHGDTPTAESLARIVEVVRRHRSPGADPHPLNRLGAERALRERLIDDPSLAGLARLEACAPPIPRANLKDPIPCVATGVDDEGRPAVVVCSVGIDLDVVPFAADARLAAGDPDARLLVAVPGRDAVPLTERLAASLRRPASVLPVAP